MMEKRKGMTLIEILVSVAIFGLLTLAASWILITSLRSHTIIWDQLLAANEGRKVLQQVVDDVRRAEPSSIGAYPIETATTNTFTFFANIDSDSYRERVRYWLATTTLKKGVIKPSGNPLQYSAQNEQVVDMAHDVVNAARGVPVFSYFNANYAGTGLPLPMPVTSTDVRVVRVQLELERDPTKSPVPLHVETTVQIRSLKLN